MNIPDVRKNYTTFVPTHFMETEQNNEQLGQWIEINDNRDNWLDDPVWVKNVIAINSFQILGGTIVHVIYKHILQPDEVFKVHRYAEELLKVLLY